MATVNYELTTGIWRRISAAGEEGTAWIKSIEAGNVIYIDHTISPGAGPPNTIEEGSAAETTAGINRETAYPLREQLKILPIEADTAADVYYAMMIDKDVNTVQTAELIADVV